MRPGFDDKSRLGETLGDDYRRRIVNIDCGRQPIVANVGGCEAPNDEEFSSSECMDDGVLPSRPGNPSTHAWVVDTGSA